MAYFPCYKVVITLAIILVLVFPISSSSSSAQLCGDDFYKKSCPNLLSIVRNVVQSAIRKEARMGASLLRLHFHDCFVNGCDGSILLDDTSSFKGEKGARPNLDSVRGFDVVDNIKSAVENACPGVVSCADILAISARDSVVALGGPNWEVKLARRDARTTSLSAANNGAIPPPTSNLTALINRWNALKLSTTDLVALSGAHTIGEARCTNFRARIYNESSNELDGGFAKLRQANCPAADGSGDHNLAPLDLETPTMFDNNYYKNLYNKKGLLHSDQILFMGDHRTNPIVERYIHNPNDFSIDFVAAMIKMGDISPLTGTNGEIRKNCRKAN